MKLFICIVCIVFSLYADDEHHEKRNFHGSNLLIPLYDLSIELDGEQKEAVKNLFKELRKKLRHLKKNDDFKEEYAKEFAKEAFAKEKFLEIKRREQKENIEIEIEYLERLHQILNKEQREKFAKEIEEWEFE